MHLTTAQTRPGVHCETTMLRNMLRNHGPDISEPMLFGLGEGIDFQYWESPDPATVPPMLTGRIGPAEVTRNACRALGVELHESRAEDPDSAHEQAVELLDAGHVVGITVDIFHLDYFSSRSHFSAHFLALHHLDDEFAHVVDTAQQGGARRLPIASLRKARASAEGFMPSPHAYLYVDGFPDPPGNDPGTLPRARVWPALRATATRMLGDRGPHLGITGMRNAASRIPSWSTLPAHHEIVPGVGRFWRYAGTGGTNFRGLFLEFLREADALLGPAGPAPVITEFEAVRQGWDDLIDQLLAYNAPTGPETSLTTAAARMTALADAEEHAFRHLLALAGRRSDEAS